MPKLGAVKIFLEHADALNGALKGNRKQFLLFSGMFVILCLIFGYQEVLPEPPIGLHYWRQTDCTALAANYYKHGMHFFEPQIYHILGGEGKAVSEFPIIYYFVAGLYHLFGQHDIIFRLVNIFIVFWGLWAYFKICLRITENESVSLLLTGFLFTSTVLAVYTLNFLPDAPAFAFVLIGLNWFFRFAREGNPRLFYMSMAALTLAGLLKATTYITGGAIGLLFLAEWIFRAKIQVSGPVFRGSKWKYLLAGLASMGILGAWYMWAIHYNDVQGSFYFSTKTWPIWEMPAEDITMTWDLIFNYWKNDYFYRKIWIFVAISPFVPMAFLRKAPRLPSLVMLILAGGGVGFLFFWFLAFKNHDYYFIHFLPFFSLAFPIAVATLQEKFPVIRRSVWPSILLFVVLGFSARNTHIQFNKRFEPDGVHYDSINENLFGFATKLDSLGISREDPIISLPDFTPNASLYQLDRPGWTELYLPELKVADTDSFMSWGAKYMVINDPEWVSHPAVAPWTGHLIYTYKDIQVFDLQPYKSDKP